MQFTDDEIEIIKEVFSDWGSDMPYADYDKVRAIGVKLGVWEEEKPPTEEELARRKAFQESPLQEACSLFTGKQWSNTEQTHLRINIPKDYLKS